MKLFLVIISVFSFSASFSQDNNREKDIAIIGGIQFNKLDYGKFGLMYRQKIKGNWRLKLSGTYDLVSSGDLMHKALAFESDSLKIYRTQREWDRLYTIRGGFDFELNKFLSFGAGLVLGLNSSSIDLYDYAERYDSNTESWEACISCTYDYHGRISKERDNRSTTIETVPYGRLMGKNTYLIYGLSLNAGIKLPLGERWEIGLVYSPEITRHELLKSDIYYKGSDLFVNDFSSKTRFMHYTDLHLRFRL